LEQYHEKNKQFIPISFELLENSRFRNKYLNKKRFRTYLWLRRFVIRGMNFFDPYNMYLNYSRQGKLAVCLPLDRVAIDLNLPKSTVYSHIQQLEQDGIIMVESIEKQDPENSRRYNVYILGNKDSNGETWLIDEAFNNNEEKE